MAGLLLLLGWTVPVRAATVINVKDFGALGNGRTDDTKAFLAAVAKVNSLRKDVTLLLPAGTYLLTPQTRPAGQLPAALEVLFFEGCRNLTIQGGKSTKIRFATRLYYGAFRADARLGVVPLGQGTRDWQYRVAIGHGIGLKNCMGVSVSGIEIDGNNSGFTLGSAFGDSDYQINNDGLYLESATEVTVTDCYIHHFGRDGLLLLNPTPQEYNTPHQHIRLKNCRFEYNGRQGFSWVGGVGVVADNCSFSYSGQGKVSSSPRAGVDFEPNAGYIAKGGIFRNCTFYRNAGVGIITDAGGPAVRDFQFINCTVTADGATAVWVKGPAFSFTGCTISGGFLFGYAAENATDGTRFTRCSFTDAGTENGRYNYLVESNGARYLLFDGCRFSAAQKALVYLSPGSRNEAEKPVFNDCTFTNNFKSDPIELAKASLFCTDTRFTGNTTFVNNAPRRREWNIARSSMPAGGQSATNVTIGKNFTLLTYDTVTLGGGSGRKSMLTLENGGALLVYPNAGLQVAANSTLLLKKGGALWVSTGVNFRLEGKLIATEGAALCVHEGARTGKNGYKNIRLQGQVSFEDNADVKLGLNNCKHLKK